MATNDMNPVYSHVLHTLLKECGVETVLAGVGRWVENGKTFHPDLPVPEPRPVRRKPRSDRGKGRPRRVNKSVAERAFTLRKQGQSWQQVAAELRFGKSTLQAAVRKYYQRKED